MKKIPEEFKMNAVELGDMWGNPREIVVELGMKVTLDFIYKRPKELE